MSHSLAARMTRMPSEEMIEAYYAAMRPFWHPVLPSAHLSEDAPVAVELLAEPLVVARLNGKVVAMQDVCRHFQAQLSLGEIRHMPDAGDCLMCPYHGWTFDQEGRCVDIPQLGAGRGIPRDARVPTYLSEERYGLIWVCLEQPTYALPTLPLVDDPAFVVGPLRDYPTWVSSAPRVIMAALDDTHGPWVHGGTLGDRGHPAPPDHTVDRDGQYLNVRFTMLQPTNTTIGQGEGKLREVLLRTTVGIPNMIHFEIRPLDSADGRCTVIWQAVSPRRYNATDTFWGSARNYDRDAPAWDPAFESFQDEVREQDRRVVESQRPWLLPPFWSKVELPLRPADLPLIEYHLWLEELGIAVSI